jgi:hypothetical protein
VLSSDQKRELGGGLSATARLMVHHASNKSFDLRPRSGFVIVA